MHLHLVDDPAGLARLALDHALLDPDEQARAARLHRPVDRDLYVAAHVLLRRALSCHGPLAAPDWCFQRAAYGRPELAAASQAGAADLRFSLSHTPGLVCCAIAAGGAVGVDAERHRNIHDAPALARRFFSPAEAALVAAAGDAAADLPVSDPFHALWVLKEAHLKAVGLGIVGGLERFRFCFGAAEPVAIRLLDTLDAGAAWGAALLRGAAADWSLAVAIPTAEPSRILVYHGADATDLAPPRWFGATGTVTLAGLQPHPHIPA